MTKKIKKSLLITSLLAASFLGFGAVASLNTVEAKATTTTDFETVFGASIRISEPNGIRFKMQVSEATKTEVFAENSGKSLGMYIFLGSKIDTVDYSTLSQKIELSFTEDDLYKVGDYWYANGVMTNLYVQNFNKEFVGVGYIATTDGEKTTYEYSKVNAADNVRSISNVAIEAYNDPEANVQTEMVALIEKAVYAKYGVVESREKTEGVTIYSFAKDENTWDSYEKMQAALPISLSVNQKDLHVGESLDLGAALTVNNTNIVGLDIPFSYSVDSEAVTLKDGVATAVGTGTANVTVSFGKYTQTVEINVTEEANVVFNPASSTAKEQVSFGNKAFNYGDSVTTTFVSADKNGNETYGGAYMHVASSNTGWGNVFVTPVHEMDAYKDYDAVSAWIYVESSKAENFNATFFNDLDLSRVISTNKWMQVTIPMAKFLEKGDGSIFFNSINYTESINAVCIGEIKGINYEEKPDVVFDPAMGNTMQISYVETTAGIFTNVAKLFISAAQNEDETYGGAYLRVLPNNLNDSYKYGYINIAQLNNAEVYSDYTHFVAWVYVENVTGGAVNITVSGVTNSVTANQWTSVKISKEDYLENPSFSMNWRNNGTWGITGVRIGEITAIKEVRTDVFVFDPASADAASQISIGTNNANLTMSYVSAGGAYSDATYSGAYYQFKQNISATNTSKWSKVLLTPELDLESYKEYTTIVAWIYLISKDASYNMSLIGGAHTETITPNQWVAVEIPVTTFITGIASYFCDVKYTNTAATATWGVDGLLIGEITAVK